MRRVFLNRTALVTGGARRLGFEIARAIAAEGGNLVVTYHTSSREDVRRAIAELKESGSPRVDAYRCNLADPRQFDRFCAKLSKERPRIDYLVNSAANFIHENFFEASRETFDETMALNIRAPFLLAQHVAQGMKSNGFGRIVNIADIAGFVPFPGYLAYSMSKAALIAMTKGLAKVLAPEVLVNCVAPGPVLLPQDFDAEEAKSAVEPTLLKRTGSPEEIAAAVVFLLRSEYITGVTIPVDGGRLLR